ncbi:MAG: hypothetical protein IKB30_05585 [Clostridia bacterium]|nr:hypothetical protein [Clostridia bacterium]
MSNKVCSFFGHRKIEDNFSKDKLFSVIEDTIKRGYDTFLFGGFGEFDDLCFEIVNRLKGKYEHIKTVYCLENERFLSADKRPKYLTQKGYDEFVYFELDFNYWYTKIYYRNCEMIKNSDFIIFYALKKENSGAYKALKYAHKLKKEYLNLC